MCLITFWNPLLSFQGCWQEFDISSLNNLVNDPKFYSTFFLSGETAFLFSPVNAIREKIKVAFHGREESVPVVDFILLVSET